MISASLNPVLRCRTCGQLRSSTADETEDGDCARCGGQWAPAPDRSADALAVGDYVGDPADPAVAA
ncbi:MAG: hypothetical protein KGZ69_06130 [Methylomonas sp.]|nr:hypothetical protein [Methylomonas sp.]